MNSHPSEPVAPTNGGVLKFTIDQIRSAVVHWGADAADLLAAKPGAAFGPNAALAIEVLATMDFQKESEGECPAESPLARVIGALDGQVCTDVR